MRRSLSLARARTPPFARRCSCERQIEFDLARVEAATQVSLTSIEKRKTRTGEVHGICPQTLPCLQQGRRQECCDMPALRKETEVWASERKHSSFSLSLSWLCTPSSASLCRIRTTRTRKRSGEREAPTVDIANATPSALTPSGELYETFHIGTNATDVQRENLETKIKGQIVQWTLPVYEVRKERWIPDLNVK